MIEVDVNYLEAANAPTRTSYISAMLSKGDLNALISKVNSAVGDYALYSNPDLLKENINLRRYITNEKNRVTCDGTFYFINNKTTTNPNQPIPFYGGKLSSDSGETGTSGYTVAFSLSKEQNNTGMLIDCDEILKNLTITYKTSSSGQTVETIEITNNNQKMIIVESKKTSQSFNYVSILVKSTYYGRRSVKINSIKWGDHLSFAKDEISSYDVINETCLDGSDVVFNSCSISIRDKQHQYDILRDMDNINKIREYKWVQVYHNLKVGRDYIAIPLGMFKIDKMKFKKNEIAIEGYDALYYIEGEYRHSKFYSNNSSNGNFDVVKSMIGDLLSDFGITNYEVIDCGNGTDYQLTNGYLYGTIKGYLKIQPFKECLRQILEATSGFIRVDPYTSKVIVYVNAIAKKEFNNLFTNAYTYEKGAIRNIEYETRPQYSKINIETFIFTETWNVVFSEKVTMNSFEERIIELSNPISTSKEIRVTAGSDSVEIVTQENNIPTYANIIKIRAKKALTDLQVDIMAFENTMFSSIIENKNENVLWDNGTLDVTGNNLINTTGAKAPDGYVYKNKMYNNDDSNRIAMFNFETKVLPYIEIGDGIEYNIAEKKSYKFLITKREFSDSIVQTIEGK